MKNPENAVFTHRTYLGWITDLATHPDPNALWPSMRRDADLLADYDRALDTIQELEFDALCVWGLAASRDWPLDLAESLTPDKREFAAHLAQGAHSRGLRLLAGSGVYSWGFETIIAAHPRLARTNARALCPSVPESDDWMRRVVDFVFAELEIDGVQMQSADLGRCACADCARWNDLEYHARLNTQVASYIRAQWPDKTIGVNAWGMDFSKAQELEKALPLLREMGTRIDYFTGIDDASSGEGEPARRILIETLPCAVGTLGGPQVEPPQHWERDRWFLPIARRTGEHLAGLARDGGRSCEAFFHIDANPGDELSLWVRGYALQDPDAGWQTHLRRAVERLYAPHSEDAAQALCAVFERAEVLYFDSRPELPARTFSLEPLVSATAGPPIYLNPLGAAGRAHYAQELLALVPIVQSMADKMGRPGKIAQIAVCLQNAAQDALSYSPG